MLFRSDGLSNANPHALETIVQASAKRSIVASEDIFDERGTKLLARGQPVSASLQQKLLERKLKKPLESNLEAIDGVSPLELKTALETYMSTDNPIARALLPWRSELVQEVAKLKVHSIIQLLLTAAQAARPTAFFHAIHGMGLAGAMWLHSGGDRSQLQLALLGGLLHDIGEMYVNPEYLDAKQPLDTSGYRNVAVHPRTGAMVLGKMANYPEPLVRAIAEHHERLDGTGYPARLMGSAISPLGRLLAVVEVTLGIAATSKVPWAHASFALRMIPGELDGVGVSFVTAAAHNAKEDLASDGDALLADLSLVDGQLAAALAVAVKTQDTATSRAVKSVAERAMHLLSRLRAGWNEMGLWAIDADSNISPETRFEVRMAGRELAYRLRFIRRECLWPVIEMTDFENQALAPLWTSLEAPVWSPMPA